MRDGPLGIEGEAVVAPILRGSRQTTRIGAFEREQAQLRRDAAVRREAAELAAGREHAVAGHDDRERVAPEGLTHGARGAGRADPSGDLAVGERRARRDRARRLVDAAVERRYLLHVERDRRQIARLAAQQCDDGGLRALHVARRQAFARARETPAEPRARLGLARLGELHSGDAALAPRDAAATDRRVEERETLGRHAGHGM